AAGGTAAAPLDLYVHRLPPDAAHFWSQRVRQAYDDFALPPRMAAELSVLPVTIGLLARRRFAPVAIGAALLCAMAEVGRRRAGGTRHFPPSCSLLAPVWVAERGVCAWLAVWSRVARGGVPYAGTILSKAATPRRELRRRLADRGAATAPDPPK
ncbi:MAG: glycosyltransferase family 2 protein, partial [Acidimicrobiia bacterium]